MPTEAAWAFPGFSRPPLVFGPADQPASS